MFFSSSGYRPQYECKEVLNSSSTIPGTFLNQSITREYEKCSIKTILNETGAVTVSETGCTHGWNYHELYGEFSNDRSVVSEVG